MNPSNFLPLGRWETSWSWFGFVFNTFPTDVIGPFIVIFPCFSLVSYNLRTSNIEHLFRSFFLFYTDTIYINSLSYCCVFTIRSFLYFYPGHIVLTSLTTTITLPSMIQYNLFLQMTLESLWWSEAVLWTVALSPPTRRSSGCPTAGPSTSMRGRY